jgi:hypothetical protein
MAEGRLRDELGRHVRVSGTTSLAAAEVPSGIIIDNESSIPQG